MKSHDLAEAAAVGLSPDQYALLSQLLDEEGLAPTETTIPVSRDGANVAPLSFAQQQLWIVDRLLPGSPVYILAAALRLRGGLNSGVLQRSLLEVARRHEILRTTFEERDGVPVQVVGEARSCRMRVVDLGAVDETTRHRELIRMAQEDAHRPFDLARGPLLRTTLVRLGPDDDGLLISLHHIVSDAWSLGILIRELTQLYAAYAGGRRSPLPDLPIQYRDYAVWQRQRLQGDGLAEQSAFWTRQLGGDLPVLQLPTDRPRPATPTFRGAIEPVQFPAELSAGLRAMSQREGVTLFMVLLASLQVLLCRLSGQHEILIGVSTANRDCVELEPLIGFFVNVLVLRLDLRGEPTVRQLLARVRDVAVGAYAHQEFPFERLVQEIAPERDPSRNPLVQVIVTLENLPPGQPRLSGITLERLGTAARTSAFDLSASIADSAGRLSAAIGYSTELFDATTIRRLLGHWQVLLRAMLDDGERAVADLPLLGEAERAQIVSTWNATTAALPDVTVPALFETQAAAAPDAVALVAEDQHVSYGELDRRGNQLGRALRARGVGPDRRVGVCLERSPALVVALLGVLKAGAAYVPVDPETPPARVRFVLTDAAVALVLADARTRERVTTGERQVIALDAEWADVAAQPDEPLDASDLDPQHLAYVIYTSGSTGQPKGVMVPHRGLVNYLTWCRVAYAIGNGSGTPLHASVSTDLTVTSVWAPLVAGQRVVLVPPAASVVGLAHVLEADRDWTLVKLTPAHLDGLRELLTARTAPGRTRALVIGGEALHDEQLVWWRTHAPATRLINEYGPTETVVGCCVHESREAEGGRVPIGRPIANTTAYVLDGAGQPAPIGVAGELSIGGAGVTRGYWRQPALTAERFVPDPFGASGARLYRTGDVARYRANGTLEFLGRRDHQVKLRGYRIELGEIEAVLRQYAGVRDAVVLRQDDESGQPQLVGYVVGEADVTALCAHLRGQLPDYMVPAHIVRLDQLPLTAGGKIDRQRLPAWRSGDDAPLDADAPLLPRDLLELELTQLWEACLGVDAVGVRDDFFEVGGHSLRVIALMAAVKRRFGRVVPVRVFLETPTVEHLAVLLRRAPEPLARASCVVPIQSAGTKTPFFCAPPGGGSPIHFRSLAQCLGKDQPFYGLQAPGLEGEQQPFSDWTQLARHYIQGIEQVQPEGPYFLGGWSSGARIALEMAQQLHRRGDEVRLLAIFDEQIESVDASVAATDDVSLLMSMVGFRLAIDVETLRQLSPDDRLLHVLGLAKSANLLPPDYGLAHARRQLEVFRGNVLAAAAYKPCPYEGRVTVFWASEGIQRDGESQSALWRALAKGGVETHVVPGNHLTMMRRSIVPTLASLLRDSLDRAHQLA